ncbi:MAG: hypothetical protein M1840_007197 [Geoglossum simile]|nr:MAG: hypothetical protein M1840_007197 [Geoglossum simile]
MLRLFLLAVGTMMVSAQDPPQKDFFTRLIDYIGCNTGQTITIRNAFIDSWQVMNVVRDSNIDWNSAAAMEYLGPPGYNQARRGNIQDIIHNLGTITGDPPINTDLDWKIRVRCDDWKRICSGSEYDAYTTNTTPNPTINFCGPYCDNWSLKRAINAGMMATDPRYKYDMRNYERTTGYTLIHELLHVFFVTEPPGLWATLAKILARYRPSSRVPDDLGNVIMSSAENLGLYALAVYVQQKMGAYPHLPLVNSRPSQRPWFTDLNPYFLINGTGGVVANPSAPDDTASGDNTPDDNTSGDQELVISDFIDDSELPQDYLAAWKAWSQDGVGLTNLHIDNSYQTGWISTSAPTEASGKRDVPVKKGDSVAVFDGWVKYWTSDCPGAEATFIWEETYGDVTLKDDGYMHDSAGNQIGEIQFVCGK